MLSYFWKFMAQRFLDGVEWIKFCWKADRQSIFCDFPYVFASTENIGECSFTKMHWFWNGRKGPKPLINLQWNSAHWKMHIVISSLLRIIENWFEQILKFSIPCHQMCRPYLWPVRIYTSFLNTDSLFVFWSMFSWPFSSISQPRKLRKFEFRYDFSGDKNRKTITEQTLISQL